MKKTLIILFLCISAHASACSCIRTSFSKKDYDYAKLILKGKVLKVNADKEKYYKIITFKVLKSYKGKVKNIIKIRTPISGASCGVPVNKDDKWLFFINDFKNSNYISLCDKHIRYNKRPNQDKAQYKKNCRKLKSYIKKLKSYKNE